MMQSIIFMAIVTTLKRIELPDEFSCCARSSCYIFIVHTLLLAYILRWFNRHDIRYCI